MENKSSKELSPSILLRLLIIPRIYYSHFPVTIQIKYVQRVFTADFNWASLRTDNKPSKCNITRADIIELSMIINKF
ncbi:unnamed protein product [Rotaria magnacalcarata]